MIFLLISEFEISRSKFQKVKGEFYNFNYRNQETIWFLPISDGISRDLSHDGIKLPICNDLLIEYLR